MNARAVVRSWASRLGELDPELRVASSFLALGAIGWWIASPPLAIVGMLGAATASALFVWQRECLTGVSYSRLLGQTRASFGEEVPLEIEIVNDKLLPLSWLQIDDRVPSSLEIRGGTVVAGRRQSYVSNLVSLCPMLPYQRSRRKLTVVCTQRGEHRFGPAALSSGDPVGLRTRHRQDAGESKLIVYPKVFALAPASIASRVLIGTDRSRYELVEDPSRVVGVRQYRPGDPLRHVDWRATARRRELLVRQFEPSVTLGLAVFVDFPAGRMRAWSAEPPELELNVSIAASLLADVTRRKVATGLYATGAVDGKPLAYPPSSSPAALAIMLEGLAKASSFPAISFAEVLAGACTGLQRGTSVVVVASDYPEPVLAAIGELRRRFGVTAVFVECGHGTAPYPGLADLLLSVRYTDDWIQRELLELAA